MNQTTDDASLLRKNVEHVLEGRHPDLSSLSDYYKRPIVHQKQCQVARLCLDRIFAEKGLGRSIFAYYRGVIIQDVISRIMVVALDLASAPEPLESTQMRMAFQEIMGYLVDFRDDMDLCRACQNVLVWIGSRRGRFRRHIARFVTDILIAGTFAAEQQITKMLFHLLGFLMDPLMISADEIHDPPVGIVTSLTLDWKSEMVDKLFDEGLQSFILALQEPWTTNDWMSTRTFTESVVFNISLRPHGRHFESPQLPPVLEALKEEYASADLERREQRQELLMEWTAQHVHRQAERAQTP